MTGVEVQQLIDVLEAEGIRLAQASQQASLDAAVPSCPGWTVRDLITHIGGVHRWAAAIVGGGLPESDDATNALVGTGPDDAVLLDWYRDGHRGLVETLRAAPADLACFTFLPAPTPLTFWARRQAHETTIHRVDAETACGPITPCERNFAVDGIGEILLGFAARRKTAMSPASMHLEVTDSDLDWLVTFGPAGVVTTSGRPHESNADVVVSGSAADMYLWLWNRPATVSITGDSAAAEHWQQIKVRWS
jgi:uncharacterized protein (TIGR03083 family)